MFNETFTGDNKYKKYIESEIVSKNANHFNNYDLSF